MSNVNEANSRSGLWKDYFDRKSISAFATVIEGVYPRFDKKRFITDLFRPIWPQLELKERLGHIARILQPQLPKKYDEAVKVLITAAPKLPEFENWALTTYVELFGLEHFESSIDSLKALTPFGTAEFAIRPFIINHTKRMLPILNEWTTDPNEHVRRLAAEGSRPRGVWVAHIMSFRKNPKPVLALLEHLKADPSLYVRKAVANNLNDISHDHPDKAVAVARRWYQSGRKETQWIVKRACRTLIKQGHPDAMAIFGFSANPQLELKKVKISPKKVLIGSNLHFSIELASTSKSDQQLSIDYAIDYLKANNGYSRKVFKLTEKTLPAGEVINLSKSHSFKALSTRKHYPGRHGIELIVNGKVIMKRAFTLIGSGGR